MKKERFLSLRVKLTIGVVVICFVIGLISILSVQRIATDVIDKEYRDRAEQIAEAVVTTIDPEEAYEITDLVMTAYRSIEKEDKLTS